MVFLSGVFGSQLEQYKEAPKTFLSQFPQHPQTLGCQVKE
jgi:hypothetical protein